MSMNGLKNVVFFRLEEKTVWNANKLIDMLREVGCTTTVLDTKDLEDYWKLCKHFEADFIRNNKMSVGRNEFKEWFERTQQVIEHPTMCNMAIPFGTVPPAHVITTPSGATEATETVKVILGDPLKSSAGQSTAACTAYIPELNQAVIEGIEEYTGGPEPTSLDFIAIPKKEFDRLRAENAQLKAKLEQIDTIIHNK